MPQPTYYTNGVDSIEAWICELTDPPQANLTVEQLTDNLNNSPIPAYFEQLSAGRYEVRFVPGGTTSAGWFLGCRGTSPGTNTAAFFAVPNLESGFGYSGNWTELGVVYPDNGRRIMAGFRDGIKDMNLAGIAAVTARSFNWASSFTGAIRDVYTDNPMDMTSLGNRGVLHTGTIAVNRYAAGWIEPDQVHIFSGGFDRISLSVDWEPGTQMVVVPTEVQGRFLSLGARVAKRHDRGIPKEGVESYIVDHECRHAGSCYGADRTHTPWPHDTEFRTDTDGQAWLKNPLKHVFGVGQSFEWNNVTVSVVDREGDQWIIELSDGTQPGTPYQDPDTAAGDWFVDDNGNVHEANINRIAHQGITVGCATQPESLYCPDRSVTRAEMATFLLRVLGQDTHSPAKTNQFADVAEDAWYTNYVHLFAELGVDTGQAEMWRPDDPLTRREMAYWMVATFDDISAVPAPLGLFDDVARDDWETIEGIYRVGVTFGCSDESLLYCPDQPVTRGQMASFIIRALQ